ncbi:C39 family peptidase [bacterium]
MRKREPRVPGPGSEIIELENFEVCRQETDHTCGPCAVRMILKYLGRDIDEKKIAALCLTHPLGTLHWTLLAGFRKLLKPLGFSVEMSENDPDIYSCIKNGLRNGRPVMFIYGVIDDFHPPKKVTHYGIVTGVDEPAGEIMIANPFGRLERMPIGEWWGRFFLHDDYLPPVEGFFMRFGILKPGTAFILKPAG